MPTRFCRPALVCTFHHVADALGRSLASRAPSSPTFLRTSSIGDLLHLPIRRPRALRARRHARPLALFHVLARASLALNLPLRAARGDKSSRSLASRTSPPHSAAAGAEAGKRPSRIPRRFLFLSSPDALQTSGVRPTRADLHCLPSGCVGRLYSSRCWYPASRLASC